MGLAYAVTAGAVLVGAAGLVAMLSRFGLARTWPPLVGVAGLVVALGRIAGGVYRPLNDVGFAHAAGLSNLDRRWGVALLGLAGLAAGGVALAWLGSARPRATTAPDGEQPTTGPVTDDHVTDGAPHQPLRAVHGLPGLSGLLGLALGLAALAPGGLRDAHYLNGRATVAGFAWVALAFAVAVMVLAPDEGDLPAAIAGTGVVAGVAALGFAAVDSAGLRAFALGVAIALVLPAAVRALAAAAATLESTASVVAVLVGVALLAVADLGAGLAADPAGPTVIPSGPIFPCPPGVARCPAAPRPGVIPGPACTPLSPTTLPRRYRCAPGPLVTATPAP